MTEHVQITQTDGVMTLLLNRPDKKNALSDAMYGALIEGLVAAEADKAVRVVAIRGAGETFCAGNDIGDFLQAASGKDVANVTKFIQLLGRFPKPLIAGVQGRAVGIGTTMLLHCDYVVLAEDARLTAPFATLGLVPEAASSMLLPLLLGHKRAFAMLAMGAPLEAAEALAGGMANEVVPPGQLEQALGTAAARIAALPPAAVQATKALMRDGEAIGRQIETEMAEFGRRMTSAEAREAFTAFMEKRAPDFSRF